MPESQLHKITKTYVSDVRRYFRMCFIESNDTGIIFYLKKLFLIYFVTLHNFILILEWRKVKNISDRAFVFIFSISYMYLGIIAFQWFLKRDEILEKIKKVDNCIIFENEEILNIATKDNRFRRTITKFIYITLFLIESLITLLWLYEFLFNYENYYKVTENGNVTRRIYTQRYIVHIWVPFDSTASRTNHFVTVILSVPSVFLLTGGLLGTDALFIGLTTYACTHFKLLKYIVKNITESETDGVIISKNNILKSEEKLKAVIIYLDHLLDYCSCLRRFYNLILLVQILWAIGFFCAVLISVSNLHLTDPMFIMYGLVAVIGTLDRIFSCCYYGNELTATAGEVHFALCECGWISESKSFKMSLVMMMVRLGRPAVLTIGGILPLTLQTFIVILRTGYSVALLIMNRK